MSNPLTEFSNTLTSAAEKGGASTVLVDARRRYPASGIAYAQDLVLTADHVITREDDSIKIGLPDGKAESALKALEESCRQRIEYLTLPLEGSPLPMPAPVPVTVGGATVFALPVERFEEI